MIIVPFSEVMNDFTNYHSKAMKWYMYTNEKILSTVGQDDSMLCDYDCRQKPKTFSVLSFSFLVPVARPAAP